MRPSKVLRTVSLSLVVGSFTTTPLTGFLVGDHRPSAAASALTLLAAVVVMLAALVSGMIERRKPRPTPLVREQMRQHDQRRARAEAHGLGLPYIESDGEISWPPVTLPKPTPEQVHRDLHARRFAVQSGEIVYVPDVDWTIRHRD